MVQNLERVIIQVVDSTGAVKDLSVNATGSVVSGVVSITYNESTITYSDPATAYNG